MKNRRNTDTHGDSVVHIYNVDVGFIEFQPMPLGDVIRYFNLPPDEAALLDAGRSFFYDEWRRGCGGHLFCVEVASSDVVPYDHRTGLPFLPAWEALRRFDEAFCRLAPERPARS